MSIPTQTSNNDLIMDIPVELSVELGRTQMQVREVLNLAPGTVVELERNATDPVDLYVNGRLVARGELVVVDSAMGIKITEVLSPKAS
jgi:flagellar motor switch protein FliN/FliY